MLIDELAFFILKLTSNKIDNYIESYKWMIDIFKEELINFIRTKKYRRSSFEETYRDIYSNEAYMKRYMEEERFSNAFWPYALGVYHATCFVVKALISIHHLNTCGRNRNVTR